MPGELGIESGVVGYSWLPESEQSVEWSKVCDRGGVYLSRAKPVSKFGPNCFSRGLIGTSRRRRGRASRTRGTHMRVGVVVGRGRTRAHVEPGYVAAVVHVRGQRRLVRGAEAGVALEGVAEVRHGWEGGGHGGGEVVRVDLSGGHWPVGLRAAAVGGEQDVLRGRRVSGVGEHGRGVRPVPLVVLRGREEVLVVVVHWRGELALEHLLGCGLLGLGRGRLLPLGALGRLGGLLPTGRALVRGTSAPLKVLQTPLKLLACNAGEKRRISFLFLSRGGKPRVERNWFGSYIR